MWKTRALFGGSDTSRRGGNGVNLVVKLWEDEMSSEEFLVLQRQVRSFWSCNDTKPNTSDISGNARIPSWYCLLSV